MDNLEQVDDDELENIIERAREMEEHYGHYFDMIIIYRCRISTSRLQTVVKEV